MKRWTKYSVIEGASDALYIGKDASFSDHSRAMGSYDDLGAYHDEKSFFDKWYFDSGHGGRLENYDNFLNKHTKASDKILSIASGRSVNEIRLLLQGFNIVCSDLEELPSHACTKSLFPAYLFVPLDILATHTNQHYDGAISLSLIYLFDLSQLNIFFRNVSNSLVQGGYLVLDSAGSPDNILSRTLFDHILKFETYVVRFIKIVSSGFLRNYVVSIKNHGYRYNDIEIRHAAASNGLKLVAQENYAFLLDFQRSRILRYIMKIPFMKRQLSILGRNIPYTRMYLFNKCD